LFGDRPILGRWEVDPFASMLQEKRRRVTLTVGDMLKLREQMKLLGGMRLIVTPDNVVRLKGPDVANSCSVSRKWVSNDGAPCPVVRVPVATARARGPAASAAEDARFAERYGQRPRRGISPTAPVPAVVRAPTAPRPAPLSPQAIEEEMARAPSVLLAEGTWREDRGRYLVTLRPQKEFLFLRGQAGPGAAGDHPRRFALPDQRAQEPRAGTVLARGAIRILAAGVAFEVWCCGRGEKHEDRGAGFGEFLVEMMCVGEQFQLVDRSRYEPEATRRYQVATRPGHDPLAKEAPHGCPVSQEDDHGRCPQDPEEQVADETVEDQFHDGRLQGAGVNFAQNECGVEQSKASE
jgi:hypothetical protein